MLSSFNSAGPKCQPDTDRRALYSGPLLPGPTTVGVEFFGVAAVSRPASSLAAGLRLRWHGLAHPFHSLSRKSLKARRVSTSPMHRVCTEYAQSQLIQFGFFGSQHVVTSLPRSGGLFCLNKLWTRSLILTTDWCTRLPRIYLWLGLVLSLPQRFHLITTPASVSRPSVMLGCITWVLRA